MNTLIRLLAAYVVATAATVIAAAFIGTAAMHWLSSYWGYPLAALAVGGVFILILLLALGYANFTRNEHPVESNPVAGSALSIFNKHPFAVMAGAGLLSFLVVKKPGMLLRMGTIGAGLAQVLKDHHQTSRRR